jgi:hypothetical protein
MTDRDKEEIKLKPFLLLLFLVSCAHAIIIYFAVYLGNQ